MKLSLNSMLRGYRRTTRYTKRNGAAPKYLAMHELDTPSMAPEINLVLGTEWSKKVIGGAKSTGFDMWEYIAEYGTGPSGEAF
jgi:hypothetical protein